jgi:hypothetical protein
MFVLGGCTAPPAPTPVPSPEAVSAVDEAPALGVSNGTTQGIVFYVDRSTRGMWAMKLATPDGVRTYYVAPGDQKKAFAQASYTLGQSCQITWVEDPTSEGDGLLTSVRPLSDKDRDISDAIDVVDQYYDAIYFLHTEQAYADLSARAQRKMSAQAFRSQWEGNVLAVVVDWNGHFEPRRVAIDSHGGDRMVILCDVTRLYRDQSHSEVRRLSMVKDAGHWKVDDVDRASMDDFLH